MSRITALGEASSVSKDDYILLSSPTLGERKISAKNLGVGGGESANRLVVFNKYMKDDYQQSIYTAKNDCIILCFNACINGQSNTKDIGSYIGTTGTVIATDYISDNWDSSNNTRNQTVKCSVIALEEGDTVTFSNSINSSYNFTVIFHIGIIVDFDINSLYKVVYETKSDNNLSSANINIPSDGIYFLVTCVTAGDYKPVPVSITHPNTETILFNPVAHDSLMAKVGFKIFTAKANDTIALSYATFTSYVSKGYYLYKLT